MAQASGDGSVASALRVVGLQDGQVHHRAPAAPGRGTGRPRALGVTAAYTGYGLPLGVAFQLRDDILGVFGDPARTGKPGDDLRGGKRTVLLAITRARASPRQAAVIDRCLADPDLDEAAAAELRAVITSTGAVAECEQLISRTWTRRSARWPRRRSPPRPGRRWPSWR